MGGQLLDGVEYRRVPLEQRLVESFIISPNIFLEELALHKKNNPSFNITNIHFFPLGGIKSTANWIKNARD